jgi:hypothetical protein
MGEVAIGCGLTPRSDYHLDKLIPQIHLFFGPSSASILRLLLNSLQQDLLCIGPAEKVARLSLSIAESRYLNRCLLVENMTIP